MGRATPDRDQGNRSDQQEWDGLVALQEFEGEDPIQL